MAPGMEELKFLAKRNSTPPDDIFEELCAHQWDAYSVSHMFNYKPELKTKNYQKYIREHVAANIQTVQPAEVKCSFTLDEGFDERSGPNSDKIINILIEISDYKSNYSKKIRKHFYEGFLLRRGIKRNTNEENKKYPQLPLLICKSTQNSIPNIVNTALCKLFDCNITPIQLNEIDMKWFIAIILEQQLEQEQQINLIFKPFPLEDDTIDISFDIDNIQRIWSELRQNKIGKRSIKESTVKELFYMIYAHFKNINSMDFHKMKLQSVLTSVGHVHSNGKFKILKSDIFEIFIRYLSTVTENYKKYHPISE